MVVSTSGPLEELSCVIIEEGHCVNQSDIKSNWKKKVIYFTNEDRKDVAPSSKVLLRQSLASRLIQLKLISLPNEYRITYVRPYLNIFIASINNGCGSN